MSDTPFTVHGDEALEARIVSWVLGEASAFEADELARLCEERPELLIYKRRMEALHGLLREAEAKPDADAWKLPPGKRQAIEQVIGESEVVRLEVAREARVGRSARRTLLSIAACLVLTIAVAALLTPGFPTKYKSKAVIEVKPNVAPMSPLGTAMNESSGKWMMTPQFFGTEFEKIKSRNSLEGVVDELGLDARWGVDKETALHRLRDNVETRNIRGTDLVEIEARDKDPQLAREITRSVTENYRAYRDGLEARDGEKQLAELNKAVRDQEDKVEERRKVLETIVRSETVKDADGDSREDAIKRGLDAQDYADAKREFESDQALLQTMKLKQVGETITRRVPGSTVEVHEEASPAVAANPVQAVAGKLSQLFADNEPKVEIAASKVAARPMAERAERQRMVELATELPAELIEGTPKPMNVPNLESPVNGPAGSSSWAHSQRYAWHSSPLTEAPGAPAAPPAPAAKPVGSETNEVAITNGTLAAEEALAKRGTAMVVPEPSLAVSGTSTFSTVQPADDALAVVDGQRSGNGMVDAKAIDDTLAVGEGRADHGMKADEKAPVLGDVPAVGTLFRRQSGDGVGGSGGGAPMADGTDASTRDADLYTGTTSVAGGTLGFGLDRPGPDAAKDASTVGGLSLQGNNQWSGGVAGNIGGSQPDQNGSQAVAESTAPAEPPAALPNSPKFAGQATVADEVRKNLDEADKSWELRMPEDGAKVAVEGFIQYGAPVSRTLNEGEPATPARPEVSNVREQLLADVEKAWGESAPMGRTPHPRVIGSPVEGKKSKESEVQLPEDVDALAKAIREQEDKVEERRKVLATTVRTKGIIYKGQDSFHNTSGVDEDQRAKSELQADHELEQEKLQKESREEAIRRGLDAQDYVDAKRGFEVEQARLQALKLKLAEKQAAEMPAVDPADFVKEVSAAQEPFSTFSLNVSDASFQVAQAALARGERPDPAGIKVEQFYNAVDYGDPAPANGEPVAVTIEQTAHPVIPNRNLVRIAVKTAAAGRSQSQPLRLTLLVDQSGSMSREDRQIAMDKALAGLGGLLTAKDEVSVIGFSRTPRLIADSLKGDQAGKIRQVVNAAASEGGTNLELAIGLAKEIASRHKLAGAQNRIVLFTDGAANLGDADPTRLAESVKRLRQSGISFDIAGVVADGLNDELLGELARHGDGRYYVVGKGGEDRFASQLAGAFRPAAENVKVQVRFNPERVSRYKLIGFEKDRLKTEDFRNDAVDAAELAANEAGVAIYQVEPVPGGNGEIGEVSVRFRDAAAQAMVERSWTIQHAVATPAFDRATPSMQLATFAMLAAEKLRGGPFAEAINFRELGAVQGVVRSFYGDVGRPAEVLRMVDALK